MSDIKSVIYDAAIVRLRRTFPDAQCILLANMMIAQAAHETGDFKSNVYKKNHNICGYRPYTGSLYQIPATASSVTGYGNYASDADCAKELADWIARRKSSFGSVSTVGAYASALKSNGYYEATIGQYVSGMEFFVKSYAIDFKNALKTGNLSSVGIIVVVGLACLLGYSALR